MKRVSFKVAKALKEAGYPPLKADWSYGAKSGELVHFVDDADYVVSAPYVMVVWLWLWREKGIRIKDTYDGAVWVWTNNNESSRYIEVGTKDPEEAIASAIEYLVNENLLK